MFAYHSCYPSRSDYLFPSRRIQKFVTNFGEVNAFVRTDETSFNSKSGNLKTFALSLHAVMTDGGRLFIDEYDCLFDSNVGYHPKSQLNNDNTNIYRGRPQSLKSAFHEGDLKGQLDEIGWVVPFSVAFNLFKQVPRLYTRTHALIICSQMSEVVKES